MTPSESNSIRRVTTHMIARSVEERARAQVAVARSKTLLSRLERNLRLCGVELATHRLIK